MQFWNDGVEMNVASCQRCAGYGVTSFRFVVDEPYMHTPDPTTEPSAEPTVEPTEYPTTDPSEAPTMLPEGWYVDPVDGQSKMSPVAQPTEVPFVHPTFAPIPGPTFYPVTSPTQSPTASKVSRPTKEPTVMAAGIETDFPIAEPTLSPFTNPTLIPVLDPTHEPITSPTQEPTPEPTETKIEPCSDQDYVKPEITVDGVPLSTEVPTLAPTTEPTLGPTMIDPDPTLSPTVTPTSAVPTVEPTLGPTFVAKELYGMVYKFLYQHFYFLLIIINYLCIDMSRKQLQYQPSLLLWFPPKSPLHHLRLERHRVQPLSHVWIKNPIFMSLKNSR